MIRVVVRVEQSGRVLTLTGWRDGYLVFVVRDGQPSTDGVLRPFMAAWDEARRLVVERNRAGDEATLG